MKMCCAIWWLAGAVLVAAAEAERDKPQPGSKTNESAVQLVVDLTDGSRVVGVPNRATLPLRTSFAKLEMALALIQSVEFKADKETVGINLNNGDRVQGALSLESLELQTAYGQVTLPLGMVRKISVVPKTTGKRSGLVLHYTFDEDNGEEVRDKSGLNYHGRLIKARLTPQGKKGNGLALSGNLDGVKVGNPEALQLQTFTVALWIKRASPNAVAAGAWHGTFVAYGPGGYGFGILPDGGLGLGRCGDPATGSAARVLDTQFHHVAVTRAAGKAHFYVDGELAAETNHDFKYEFGSELGVGAAGHDMGYGFFGTLDEVMIFNRALSGAEIMQLFNEQK